MTDIILSSRAYHKIVQHAAKYPTHSVNGVLLGGKTGADHAVVVSDAIPMFHSQTTLTAMLDIALNLVEQHCRSVKVQIVGWYHGDAFALTDDTSPNVGASRIAESIRTRFSSACLLTIKNAAVFANGQLAVIPYIHSGSSWSSLTSNRFTVEGGETTLRAVSQAVESRLFKDLFDVDESFDNVHLDWRNLKFDL